MTFAKVLPDEQFFFCVIDHRKMFEEVLNKILFLINIISKLSLMTNAGEL